MIWFWVIGLVGLLFALTVIRGAPYVPTRQKHVEVALDLLDLKAGDIVVDLGSGDGVFLRAAAKRGLRAYGYEINPMLCLVAYIRCWRYRHNVTVLWRDFWLTELPAGTRGVFVFAGGPFMTRLTKKLQADSNKPLVVASYGFELPGHTPVHQASGVNLYRLKA